MAQDGPEIKGGIELNTRDLDKAIKQIKQLERSFRSSSKKITSSVDRVGNSLGGIAKGLSAQISSSDRASRATRGLANENDRLSGNTAKLQGSLTSNINAVNRSEVAYQKLESRIKASALSDEQKEHQLREVKAALDSTTKSINMYGSRSAQAASQTANFRKVTTSASLAVADANRQFRGQGIKDFNTKFQDLSSSVQLALGPLSGVASRLIALQQLFRRGGIEAAAFFGTLTGLTVGFSRAIQASTIAETTLLRTESVLKSLGASANVTAQEIMDMGQNIAMSTLTSTKAARDAAVALAGFSGITSDSFERILITAQGVSEQFGGDLVSNTKVLARALQDPERRLTTLERKTDTFSSAVKDQIDVALRQGNVAKAQSIILDDLSSSYDLATNAAGGLAGQIDTTGELMTSLFERIGLASGATKEAANQFSDFNKAFQDFINSDAVDALGRLLVNSIRVAGKAINFLADNTDKLALIFNALLGSTVLKSVALLTRLGGSALVSAKSMFTLGKSIKTVTAAGGFFVNFLSNTNPLLKLLKFSALILTPVIGGLVAKFVSSGNEAKSATPKIDDYVGVLDKVIERADSLKNLSPSLGIDSAELLKSKNELAQNAEVIKRLRNQMQDLESKHVVMSLEQVAASAGVTKKEILDNADAISKGLAGTLDRSAISVEYEDWLDGVIVKTLSLGEQGTDNIRNYLSAYSLLPKVVSQTEELTKATEKDEEALRNRTEAVVANKEANERHSRSIRTLVSEYDKEATALQQLQADMGSAQRALEFYNSETGQAFDGAAQNVQALTRIIENIREEIYGTIEDANKLSNAFTSLSDDMDKAARKTENLQDILAGRPDMSYMFDIKDAAKQAKEAVDDLTIFETTKLGDKLGITPALGESMKEFKVRVGEAYGEYTQGQLEAQHQTQGLIEAQNRVTEALSGQKAELDVLRSKYRGLMQDAIESGSGGFVINALQQQRTEELALMKQRSEDMKKFPVMGSVEQLETERQERIEKLKAIWGEESEEYKKHLDGMNAVADKVKPFANIVEAGNVVTSALGGIMDVMKAQNREQTKSFQSLAKVQVAISSAVAIAKAIQAAPNPLAAIPQTALISAKMGAQMAAIDNAYATGGYVQGKGTSTSDSIPAMLSNGEYVINAAAVRKLGLPNLNSLNEGQIPKHLASGGSVSPMPISSNKTSNNGGGSEVNIEIVDQRTGQAAPIETSETMSPEGIRHIRVLVRDMVRETMNEGGVDRSMAQNYGVSRRPKRR